MEVREILPLFFVLLLNNLNNCSTITIKIDFVRGSGYNYFVLLCKYLSNTLEAMR